MGNNITDRLKYKESVVKFSKKYGVEQRQHINLENVKEQYIDGEKFYQYTAIDEYSRLRYTWFTKAHDTYASSEFARRLVKYFSFKIKTIQTDNGFEFTNRLSWQAFMKNKKTMFEKTIEELGIEYKVIRPHTPKQNGRVERSHRKDQERFYYKRVFYSLEDLRNQGKEWRKEYNNFPMRPLGWLSPREFIKNIKVKKNRYLQYRCSKIR